jgi:hypothetical protein
MTSGNKYKKSDICPFFASKELNFIKNTGFIKKPAEKICFITYLCLPLHRVFHGIRFKVNNEIEVVVRQPILLLNKNRNFAPHKKELWQNRIFK